MTTKNTKILIKAGILALIVAVIFLLSPYIPQPFGVLESTGEELGRFYSSKKGIVRFLGSLGPYSSGVFILLQALQVVVAPIPGELTGVVGGYLYGELYGFLLSTIGLTLGSWAAFELAKILGRPFVARFVKKETLERFNFLTSDKGLTICFLLFLLPVFPKDALCYVLGLSGMGLSTFLVVSTIGRMPGTYLLTIQGVALGKQAYYTAGVIMAISAAILFIAYLYRAQLINWLSHIRAKIVHE